MWSLLKRYRELLVVGFLLVFPFATFIRGGGKGREPNLADRALIAVSSWVQGSLIWTVDGASEVWSGYVALRGAKVENAVLRGQNARLMAQVHALDEVRAENARLRGLLAYGEGSGGAELVARVVGVNPVPTLLSVRIDRGEDHGVRKGMAVVTPDGVVGHVERVIGSYSDVVLIRDRSTAVGVRFQGPRTARASAVGAGGELSLRLEYALRTEDLKDDDVVITSGTDGIYPPGLLVGRLAKVQKGTHGMFQSAEIVPAVDTTRLEEVLVLTGPLALPQPAPGGGTP